MSIPLRVVGLPEGCYKEYRIVDFSKAIDLVYDETTDSFLREDENLGLCSITFKADGTILSYKYGIDGDTFEELQTNLLKATSALERPIINMLDIPDEAL